MGLSFSTHPETVSALNTVHKFGSTNNADSGVETDLWDGSDTVGLQPVWLAPTAARVHQIVSTDVNDTSAGTGARTVKVWGLTSWDSVETSETLTMNGTTNVPTTASYVIIHRIRVVTTGASGPNVGRITATADTDATVTAAIAAGNGQTSMAIYGVPSVESFYMDRLYANLIDAATGTDTRVELHSTTDVESQPNVWTVKHVFGLRGTGTSALSIPYSHSKVFPGPCIIKLDILSDVNNTVAGGGFDGHLVDV